VKLSDQYNLEAFQPDVNARAPAFVVAQLGAAGLKELAALDFWEGDVRLFWVATDAGIYLGTFSPRLDIRFDAKLEATLTPWQNVTGVRIGLMTEMGEETTLRLKIEEPAFERSAQRDRERKALAEFGKVCLLKHHAG
jgi:hypothetical protein